MIAHNHGISKLKQDLLGAFVKEMKDGSGQRKSRPHTIKNPKWWFSKGNPLISGKSRLVKYYNLARWFVLVEESQI